MGQFYDCNIKGYFIASGKIRSSKKYYNCETDLNLLYHDKYYDLFISNKGDKLVKNGNGFIKENNELNILVAEGQIKGSLKNSEVR